jgi:SAM-dependent methyltransferase
MTRVPAAGFGENDVLEFVLRHLEGCSSVLDAGCNTGKYLLRIKSRRPDIVTAALDAHEPALAQATADRKILGAMPDALWRCPSADAVLCLDVIEHLSRDDGFRSLGEFAGLAKKKIVVFTPWGFQPQESDNPWMTHKSGWEPEDFEREGYEVTVWEGFHGQDKCPDALWAVRSVK